MRYRNTFVDKIRPLASQHDDSEIAAMLNRDGLTSSTGKPFTASMISWIRFKHRIAGPERPAGTLTVKQVQARYGISMGVVYYWIERGYIPAQRRKPGSPYAITLTDEIDRNLRDRVANSSRITTSSPDKFE